MEASREEILADFQACTGIDNVAESIMYLDEANWVLVDAVNRVVPQDSQTLPSERREAVPVDVLDEAMDTTPAPMVPSAIASGDRDSQLLSMPVLNRITPCDDAQPSSSSQHTRLLNFHVEYCGQIFPVVVRDNDTVAEIKTELFGQLGVPPCKQRLEGWKHRWVTDSTKLSALNLPKENNLNLYADESPLLAALTNGEENAIAERLAQNHKLHIKDETNNKEYILNYPGSKTVQEVKNGIYCLTSIPVRHQIWTGWPEAANEEGMTLACSGIDFPSHSLSVRSEANQERKKVVDLASDSSADEFEDANESFPMDDIMFLPEEPTRRPTSLMPRNVTDDVDATRHFSTEFTNRYGDCTPIFFQGSLDDALREACNRPARERKPLAVYLHHDSSVLTNVFCTQVLCAESLVSFLTNNFIVWGWDLTHESNRASFLGTVMRHFGSVAAATIRNIDVEKLPLLLLIMKNRSSTEVFSIIHGSSSLDELLTNLIQAVDVFTTQQQSDAREEDEREARENVKREQDLAYEESLMADRAKEEKKRAEAAVREAEEREQELMREKEEQIKLEEEALKQAMRDSLEQSLPKEPSTECTEPVSTIRVRLPSGEMLIRRFLASTKLEVLKNYLISKGFSPSDFKVLTSWPRRDLSTQDANATLESLRLFPQETLIIEEK